LPTLLPPSYTTAGAGGSNYELPVSGLDKEVYHNLSIFDYRSSTAALIALPRFHAFHALNALS